MSTKELNQIAIFASLKDGKMKQREAADLLGLSARQVKRKLKAYRARGATSLIHGGRGKTGNRTLSAEIKDQAMALVQERYSDFGPTFAAEKLEDDHGILVNRETLRRLMTVAGFWFPKPKSGGVHREWRERKACYGELVQLDGSIHDWFEGRGPICTLLAFVDDATSSIPHLLFAEETTAGVMQATRGYLLQEGKPKELYTDRGKVYKVNLGNEDGDKLTQYQRALGELGIALIHARSPQAKGRVERLFGTLQDRLVKELRLANISTIEEANSFLETYRYKHNQMFAVLPKSETNLHQVVTENLDAIFCLKEERTLTNDFTLRYNNRWFQLARKQQTILFPKNKITVSEYLDCAIQLTKERTSLTFTEIPKPSKRERLPVEQVVRKQPAPAWKPPQNHPWRDYPNKHKSDISKLRERDISILV